MAEHKTEEWYCWRELVVPDGETEPRLLVPWADPHLYEWAMDWRFPTPEDAHLTKADLAPKEGWLLVKETAVVIDGPWMTHETDDECPKCESGTLEVSEDTATCRGECGSIFPATQKVTP